MRIEEARALHTSHTHTQAHTHLSRRRGEVISFKEQPHHDPRLQQRKVLPQTVARPVDKRQIRPRVHPRPKPSLRGSSLGYSEAVRTEDASVALRPQVCTLVHGVHADRHHRPTWDRDAVDGVCCDHLWMHMAAGKGSGGQGIRSQYLDLEIYPMQNSSS